MKIQKKILYKSSMSQCEPTQSYKKNTSVMLHLCFFYKTV